MCRKIFEALGIDGDEIEIAFAGNVEIFLRFLRRFPEDDAFAKLREAVSRKDLSCVQYAAHGLKGVCAALRLTGLSRKAKDIETLAKNGKMEEIERRMPELLTEYEKIVLYIERYA